MLDPDGPIVGIEMPGVPIGLEIPVHVEPIPIQLGSLPLLEVEEEKPPMASKLINPSNPPPPISKLGLAREDNAPIVSPPPRVPPKSTAAVPPRERLRTDRRRARRVQDESLARPKLQFLW